MNTELRTREIHLICTRGTKYLHVQRKESFNIQIMVFGLLINDY